MDYSRMGGGVYGPDPEQMALISRLKDQNTAQTPGQVAPPVRMTPPAVAGESPNPGGQYTPPQAKVDTSKWDTDKYSAPAYTAPKAGGVLAGWDATKWADPNHQTPKYVVGRILSSGNMKDPAARQQAVADIQKAYPGATFDGKDALTIPGVGTIDIFRGADVGEFAPQWMDTAAGGGGAHGAAPLAPGLTQAPGSPQSQAPPMDDKFWHDLMAQLQMTQDQTAGQPTPTALTSQLRG